jgi:hypothetical protein
MLSIAAREDEHNWDLKFPTLLLAYRTSVHETTETPSLLMLIREVRLPVDIMYNLTPNKKDEPSGNAYTETLKENISQAYDRVRTRMDREQRRQKAVYDQSSDDRKYSVREKVWLHCPAVLRGRFIVHGEDYILWLRSWIKLSTESSVMAWPAND